MRPEAVEAFRRDLHIIHRPQHLVVIFSRRLTFKLLLDLVAFCLLFEVMLFEFVSKLIRYRKLVPLVQAHGALLFDAVGNGDTCVVGIAADSDEFDCVNKKRKHKHDIG